MKQTMKQKIYFASLVLLAILVVFWPNKPKQALSLSNADMDKIVSIIEELNFHPETEADLRNALRDVRLEELAQFFTLTPEQKAQIREQNPEKEERGQLEEKKSELEAKYKA